MAEPRVILKVGGRMFEGWTSVTIDRGLDALCGAFSLGLTERWPGQPDQWKVEAGDACVVSIDDEPILTGFIDRAAYRLEPRAHPVEMSGRERTCDLVDCSAIHAPGSWRGRTADQIAADLTALFGIAVSADVEVGRPFERFALEPGETVLEAIERMTRQRGLLPTTSGTGDLVLTRPAQTRAGYVLEEGVNLEAVAFENDVTERFSRYLIKGHDSSDESAQSPAARPSAEATDPGVRRHRPLLIVSDEESTQASLGEMARWEATVRAARAQGVTATVSGWRTAEGALYRPNVLVPVRAPTVGIVAELLVESVRFVRSAREGTRTELRLVRPEAYSLKPIPAPPATRRQAAVPPSGAGR